MKNKHGLIAYRRADGVSMKLEGREEAGEEVERTPESVTDSRVVIPTC